MFNFCFDLLNKSVYICFVNIKQIAMSTIEFNQALLDIENKLISFAYTFTRSSEDARDLTQETILKAIRYKKQYTPKTNFKAWAFTIMRNTYINQYRRKVHSKTIFDYTENSYLTTNKAISDNSPYESIQMKEILSKIDLLSSEYKVPFELHVQGFKYKEISEKLDIPIGTVKSRIFIARKKLIDLLPDYSFSFN